MLCAVIGGRSSASEHPCYKPPMLVVPPWLNFLVAAFVIIFGVYRIFVAWSSEPEALEAKKGIYGVLLTLGESEGWVTAHCSTVQVVTPYDNTVTIIESDGFKLANTSSNSNAGDLMLTSGGAITDAAGAALTASNVLVETFSS